MIILIMAIFAILAFLANMMLENRIIRITTTAVMFVGLIISVIGIIANMHDHYGMKQVTTTEKSKYIRQVALIKALEYYFIKELVPTVKKMFIFTNILLRLRKTM
ncbi:hypothetical protein GCM10025879_13360 [Leuconostoc litchii]|nr:hypothetical protein GCM10025879_13360 [Leuconostoc litchii]